MARTIVVDNRRGRSGVFVQLWLVRDAIVCMETCPIRVLKPLSQPVFVPSHDRVRLQYESSVASGLVPGNVVRIYWRDSIAQLHPVELNARIDENNARIRLGLQDIDISKRNVRSGGAGGITRTIVVENTTNCQKYVRVALTKERFYCTSSGPCVQLWLKELSDTVEVLPGQKKRIEYDYPPWAIKPSITVRLYWRDTPEELTEKSRDEIGKSNWKMTKDEDNARIRIGLQTVDIGKNFRRRESVSISRGPIVDHTKCEPRKRYLESRDARRALAGYKPLRSVRTGGALGSVVVTNGSRESRWVRVYLVREKILCWRKCEWWPVRALGDVIEIGPNERRRIEYDASPLRPGLVRRLYWRSTPEELTPESVDDSIDRDNSRIILGLATVKIA